MKDKPYLVKAILYMPATTGDVQVQVTVLGNDLEKLSYSLECMTIEPLKDTGQNEDDYLTRVSRLLKEN